MKASARVLAAVWSITFAALASAPTVTADPFGFDYEVKLKGTLSDGTTEEHSGVVTFEDISDPPEPVGNLEVSEDVLFNFDEFGDLISETIFIWLEGMGGAPLFSDFLDTSMPVSFEVNDLQWGDFTEGGIVIDAGFDITFGDTEVSIQELFGEATGSGTQSEPLNLFALLDPNDFVDGMGNRATDLHFDFEVVHFDGNGPPPNGNGFPNGIIPEPTTLLLLGTGLVGLAGLERRKRRGQKEGG